MLTEDSCGVAISKEKRAQIIKLARQGCNATQITKKLGVSYKTVAKYAAQLFASRQQKIKKSELPRIIVSGDNYAPCELKSGRCKFRERDDRATVQYTSDEILNADLYYYPIKKTPFLLAQDVKKPRERTVLYKTGGQKPPKYLTNLLSDKTLTLKEVARMWDEQQ